MKHKATKQILSILLAMIMLVGMLPTRRTKMGLIKAGLGAVGGVLADQWKEFFYCEAMDKEVMVTKGQKRVSGRSSNTKGSDNIISNGSGIAVADGQCMIIVDQGRVVEVCAEPGEFTYDASTEPSIFAGNLGQSILDTFLDPNTDIISCTTITYS